MGVTLPSKTALQRRDRLGQIIKTIPGIQVGERKDCGHNCQAKDQHFPTWKAITGLVED
jgi:hypothetical protein